jgi:dihydrofolate synthase/folylpolyglutamate synthase
MADAVRLSQEMARTRARRVYVAGGLFLAIEYATVANGGHAEDLEFF